MFLHRFSASALTHNSDVFSFIRYKFRCVVVFHQSFVVVDAHEWKYQWRLFGRPFKTTIICLRKRCFVLKLSGCKLLINFINFSIRKSGTDDVLGCDIERHNAYSPLTFHNWNGIYVLTVGVRLEAFGFFFIRYHFKRDAIITYFF